nr:MAG TPA: hypothetical protein [Caudoviricetes sp.]
MFSDNESQNFSLILQYENALPLVWRQKRSSETTIRKCILRRWRRNSKTTMLQKKSLQMQ